MSLACLRALQASAKPSHNCQAGDEGLLTVQVSPHEFMQAVMRASNKRFTIEERGDPVEFWSWFLNSLHLELTGGKRKKPSVISRCFQVLTCNLSECKTAKRVAAAHPLT